MKPTYTKKEMLALIHKARLTELEAVRVIMGKECKKYCLEDLREIVTAYKKRRGVIRFLAFIYDDMANIDLNDYNKNQL